MSLSVLYHTASCIKLPVYEGELEEGHRGFLLYHTASCLKLPVHEGEIRGGHRGGSLLHDTCMHKLIYSGLGGRSQLPA